MCKVTNIHINKSEILVIKKLKTTSFPFKRISMYIILQKLEICISYNCSRDITFNKDGNIHNCKPTQIR